MCIQLILSVYSFIFETVKTVMNKKAVWTVVVLKSADTEQIKNRFESNPDVQIWNQIKLSNILSWSGVSRHVQ